MTQPAAARTAAAAHYASLAAISALLVVLNRSQWFVGDEFDFLTYGRDEHGFLARFLEPHNEHWSTWPMAYFVLLRDHVGLTAYWPYALGVIATTIVALHLAWRIMLRAGVSPVLATAFVVFAGCAAATAGNVLWAFQLGFVGSIALGLACVLLVDHADRDLRRDAAAVALAVLSLGFSGISLVFVAVAALTACLRRGLLAGLAFAAVPAFVYGAWHLAYGRSAARPVGVGSIPSFVWEGLRESAAEVVRSSSIGIVVVLVALASLVLLARDARGPAAPLLALLLGWPVLFAVIGLGRAEGVHRAPGASRYVHVALLLMIPAIAWTVSRVVERRPVPTAVAVAVLLVGSLAQARELRSLAYSSGLDERRAGSAIVAAATLLDTPGVRLLPDTGNVIGPHVRRLDLRRWVERDLLPPAGTGAYGRLSAANLLQTGVARRPSAPVRRPCRWRTIAGRAFLRVRSSRSWPLRAASPADVELTLWENGERGGGVRHALGAGTWHLTALRPNVTVEARLVEGGPLEICR